MYHIILFLVILTPYAAKTQNPDSIKSLLHTLNGNERIDALNATAYHYMLAEKRDSSEYYQTQACMAAEQSHYIHGLAEAYSIHAQIQKFFFDNFPGCEAYCKIAYGLYEQTSDKRNIEKLYDAFWHSLISQSKYEQC